MSLLSWFTKRRAAKKASPPESSGLGYGEATVPLSPTAKRPVQAEQAPVRPPQSRKNERQERREAIYAVVRDAMTRAGVLAANYKFKVLTLDVAGNHYLVMVDLANKDAGDTARLAEIEAMIAQSAKVRHGLLVTAVYWRVNEHVTAGLSPSPAQAAAKPHTAAAPAPSAAVPAQPGYEPLQQDEVAAFKRALASALPAAPLSAPGQIVTSGPRKPKVQPDFEDTQTLVPDRRASPLSATQYGDLN
jgi:hypothetical protein